MVSLCVVSVVCVWLCLCCCMCCCSDFIVDVFFVYLVCSLMNCLKLLFGRLSVLGVFMVLCVWECGV